MFLQGGEYPQKSTIIHEAQFFQLKAGSERMDKLGEQHSRNLIVLFTSFSIFFHSLFHTFKNYVANCFMKFKDIHITSTYHFWN